MGNPFVAAFISQILRITLKFYCQKKIMIIDLHIHTTISGDSIITPEILIMTAKNAGLDGLCITEHGVKKSKIAKALSERYNFPVFGGMEASTAIGDILIFGIDSYPRNIYKIQDIKQYVEENGGVIIAAHPFRRQFYKSYSGKKLTFKAACQSQFLQLVNTMEVFNGCSTEQESLMCEKVCKKLGLHGTGGSDAHIPKQIGSCVTVFENIITNEQELTDELKSGRYKAKDLRCQKYKCPINWFSDD